LNELKESLGSDHPMLGRITEQQLRNSRALRTSLNDYKEIFFYMAINDPKALKKQYSSVEQQDAENY